MKTCWVLRQEMSEPLAAVAAAESPMVSRKRSVTLRRTPVKIQDRCHLAPWIRRAADDRFASLRSGKPLLLWFAPRPGWSSSRWMSEREISSSGSTLVQDADWFAGARSRTRAATSSLDISPRQGAS